MESEVSPKRRNRQRANGEGWINKRSDGKGYSVGLHIEHPDGTIERKATTRKKRADAASWLQEQLALRSTGVTVGKQNPTLARYTDAWLEDSVRGSVSIRTYKFYKGIAKRYIKPQIGGVKMKSLTPRMVQHLYALHRDAGFSVGTRRHVHTTLNKMLRQAAQWGDIHANPAAYVKVPKGRMDDSKERADNIRPFSEDELRRLVAATKDNRLCAIYTFAPATGLRGQELLALNWSDLDLPPEGRGRVRVERAIIETEHGFAVGPTKNRRSRRTVPFPESVVSVMKEHRLKLHEEAKTARKWEENDLVFPSATGTTLDRHRMFRYFSKAREHSGVDPRHQFRDFRHTFATLMFARNVHPKIVQEMMGHSSIKITMDIYSHCLPGMDEGAGDILGDVF